MAGRGDIGTSRRQLSSVHYFILGIIASLLVTGMADLQDVAFFAFSIIYAVVLEKFAFRAPSKPSKPPVSLLTTLGGERTLVMKVYVLFAAIIGLFLPLLYIVFHGIIKGQKTRVSSAVPHLFLLCAQIFMEGVTYTWNFSLPVQLFVPVFYNSRRLFTIVDWLVADFSSIGTKGENSNSPWRVLSLGQALAIANIIFWNFNLFGFLIPLVMPRAFKIFYSIDM